MNTYLMHREFLGDARRLVVKIGSRVLVQKNGRPHSRRIQALVRQLALIRNGGREIVIITSGAVGTGMAGLGMKTKPTALPDLQMAAAVGQARLMSLYDTLFAKHGCRVGQVLLTHDDFHNTIRQNNARRTMENMLHHRVIPIVNENDVVAVEELEADLKKLGDNDVLAGMVTKMLHADLLIMLTTADGVREFKADGHSTRIPLIEKVTPRIFKLVAPKDSGISTGGMGSKLKAAKSVAEAGISVVIADGRRPGDLSRIMKGDNVGTFILPAVAR
jgi:glutamate 5-kinase